jgi:hypothetical protein
MDEDSPLWLPFLIAVWFIGGFVVCVLPILTVHWLLGLLGLGHPWRGILSAFGTLLFIIGALDVYEHIKERSRLAKLDK